ncbi:hypothetical protein JYB62_11980, partial [Algoriphagus lutimaris]|uniref:hypothetical protein n=1 Tax=Algoriphagus lutimaris TaxID=613197 RepID=UPI00196ADE6E
TATDSDQPDKKGDLIDDSTAPSDKTDAPPSDTENKHSEEDQSDINKDTANQLMVESATEEDSSVNKDKTATDSDQPDKKGDLIDDSTAPSDKTDAPPSDTENKHSEEDQSDTNQEVKKAKAKDPISGNKNGTLPIFPE